jgi:hypothetical protein
LAKRNTAVRDQYFPFILFLISPILSLFIALKETNAKWSKNILWLFVVFFAMSLAVIYDAWDISRYIEQFKAYNAAGISFSDFWEDITTNSPDFLQPLINYLVSKITGSTIVILAIYGAIYGYFFSRNIFFAIEFLGENLGRVTGLILFAVAFIISIIDFNGFRYWTASHIFIYGLVNYYLKGRKGYGFFWIFLTFTLHFSFSLNVIVFVIHEIAFRGRVILTLALYLITLNLGKIGIEKYIPKDVMPKTYQTKAKDYTSEDNIQQVQAIESKQVVNGYVGWSSQFLKYLTWFSLVILIFEYWFKNRKFKNIEMLSMIFFFGAIANLAASNSISGGRFLSIFSLMYFLYFMFIYKELIQNYYFKVFTEYYSWVFVIIGIVNIRRLFDVMGFSALLGGPVIRAWMPEDIPIIEGFKAFFPSF